jgi:4'-phosphopantetheinyl transferase
MMLLWPTSRLPVALAPGEVHVWAWTFSRDGSPAEEDLRILDELERKRVARFRFPVDQVRYAVCHANLRRILGSYVGLAPESVGFREGAGGKPELADKSLRFNLSHSKSVAALAVSMDVEVGVDVEDIRPIDTDVAKRYFSPAENASLAALGGWERLEAFYRCWTRKEAILKAEGVGLRTPLDWFDVSLREGEAAAVLGVRPEAAFRSRWLLHSLAVAEGTMGALAVDREAAVSLRTLA